MKITKRSWFIHLLGLLALVIIFGVIFAGCDASTISIGAGFILGGIIGGSLGHVFIGIILGGIVGFIIFIIFCAITSPRGSSSSSSSRNSSSSSPGSFAESRENSPHTCGNCLNYSSSRRVCRSSGNSQSAEDRCSNWK